MFLWTTRRDVDLVEKPLLMRSQHSLGTSSEDSPVENMEKGRYEAVYLNPLHGDLGREQPFVVQPPYAYIEDPFMKRIFSYNG